MKDAGIVNKMTKLKLCPCNHLLESTLNVKRRRVVGGGRGVGGRASVVARVFLRRRRDHEHGAPVSQVGDRDAIDAAAYGFLSEEPHKFERFVSFRYVTHHLYAFTVKHGLVEIEW